MKECKRTKGLLILLCLVLVLGFTGCSNDDDDNHAPADPGGTWAATFTRTGADPMNEAWFIVMEGAVVSGTYTFGNSIRSYTGTYIDGILSAVDGAGWVLQLDFSGNTTATGTIAGGGETWNARLSR